MPRTASQKDSTSGLNIVCTITLSRRVCGSREPAAALVVMVRVRVRVQVQVSDRRDRRCQEDGVVGCRMYNRMM